MSVIQLNNPQDPVQLELYMNGAAFEKGIPVHLLTQGFEATQIILDRAYLCLAGKKKLSAEERRHFYLLSRGVKHSSLDSYLDVVLTGVQTTIPVLSALGPAGIWEHAKEAYELLKFAYAATQKGEHPTFHFDNNHGTVEVNTGSQTNTYNAPVFQIAQFTQNVYTDMAKQVNSGAIDSFSISDVAHNSTILVAQNEAAFFKPASTIDPNPLEMECEIFDFNKFEDVGKLRVFEGQPLPAKDYRFEVIGNQEDDQYIEAMLRKRVKVTCLKEVSHDPLSAEKITRLQVIKVAR